MHRRRGSAHKHDKHAEDLEHEPAVARDARVVLEEFALRATDVGGNVDRVRVDALHRLALLCDHVRELLEDLPQLGDGRLDGLDRAGTLLDVIVLFRISNEVGARKMR